MKEFGFSGMTNLTKTRAAGETRALIQAASNKGNIKLMVNAAKKFGINFGKVREEPGYRMAIVKVGNEILAYLTQANTGNKIGTVAVNDGAESTLTLAGVVAYQTLKNGDYDQDDAGKYPLDETGKVAWSNNNHNWAVSDQVFTVGRDGELTSWEDAIADGIVSEAGYVLVAPDGTKVTDKVEAIQARKLTFVGREEKREVGAAVTKATKDAKAAKPKTLSADFNV